MKVRLRSILGIPLLMLILPVLAAAQQVTFVQQSFSAPSGSVPSVQVAFTSAQTAGNLNIIVVGWTDSTTAPTAVTDTAGNTYKLAVGTAQLGSLSQAIYYAAKINAAASNTVTVTFSGSTNQPDIRILEYSGADQTVPLDVSSWNTGNQVGTDQVTSTGNGSGSSAPSTNFANELFLGAALPDGTVSAGTGFTARSGLTTGDIVEDMNVTTKGIPAVATATSTNATKNWVMEMVAIIQSGQGAVPGAAPTITSVTPSTAQSGAHVDVFIHGTNFRQGINAIFDTTPGVDCSLDPTGTIIDCFAPPHAAGTAKLVVQNLDGTESAPVDFTFSAAATADFSMSSTGSQTVTAGSSATYTITITPANGFSSAVNLTCTPPANVKITCTLSPSSVTPGSASVTSTLTVTSTAATAELLAPRNRSLMPLYATFLPLAGIAMVGGFTGRRRKLGIGIGVVLTLLLLVLLLGCGGGGSNTTTGGGGGGGGGGTPGTPAGNYNIMVTGTSGSLTHTTTAALTVQ